MTQTRRVNFEFQNQVSPRYIEPLLLKLEPDAWYTSKELRQQLRDSGLDVQGHKIIYANVAIWSKTGLGEVRREGPRRQILFRLNSLGRQVRELYSTNRVLFFDVLHYLFYSAYRRSKHLNQAPLWLYAEACDILWKEAPSKMDAMGLTAQLQVESQQGFPNQSPAFPPQSVRSVFPWLGELEPSFLSPCGSRSDLCSERRRYCTPQLFHLAIDLAYHETELSYGTSLAVDDRQIAAICRTCLLDTDRFWDMVSLTDMTIRELETRQGQWGTSLALTGPPRWINLPDFAEQVEDEDEDEEDER